MTVLFAGGEDTSGTTSGTVTIQTGSSNYDATFSRCAYQISGSTADPPANRIAFPAFTGQSDFWTHFNFNGGVNSNTTAVNSVLCRWMDGSTARLLIRATATAGQLKLTSRNAAGTLTDLATGTSGGIPAGASTNHAIDIHIHYAVSGSVDVYCDGTNILSFSGDVTTNSATTLSALEWCGALLTSSQNFGSQFIVADEDTRGWKLWTLAPQAAGTNQNWTPNTLANINKTTINDATSISTTSNNTVTEWTAPTSVPTGSWDVKAIVQEARVERAATGPQHFDWVVRTGGSDFTAGISNAPSTSFGNFGNRLWLTNPNTTVAWTTSDLTTGIQFGIESLA